MYDHNYKHVFFESEYGVSAALALAHPHLTLTPNLTIIISTVTVAITGSHPCVTCGPSQNYRYVILVYRCDIPAKCKMAAARPSRRPMHAYPFTAKTQSNAPICADSFAFASVSPVFHGPNQHVAEFCNWYV